MAHCRFDLATIAASLPGGTLCPGGRLEFISTTNRRSLYASEAKRRVARPTRTDSAFAPARAVGRRRPRTPLSAYRMILASCAFLPLPAGGSVPTADRSAYRPPTVPADRRPVASIGWSAIRRRETKGNGDRCALSFWLISAGADSRRLIIERHERARRREAAALTAAAAAFRYFGRGAPPSARRL